MWLARGLALLCLLGWLGCTAEPEDPCPPGSLRYECRQRCERDSDCLAPAVCDRLTRRCQGQAINCEPTAAAPDGGDVPDGGAPGSCPAGKECDLLTRTCLPVPGAACQQGEDCRPGEVCQDGRCAPDAEARLCARDAECPMGLVCRLTLAAGGNLRAVCGPPLGPSPPGARCLRGAECQSGICLLSGVCFGGCTPETARQDCDAAEDVLCGQVVLSTPDGRSYPRPTCTVLPRPCRRDRDCEADGGACMITADPRDPKRLLTACAPPRGRARAGGPCRADSDCPSGLCLSTYCFAACATAADCRAGFACRPAEYQVGDTRGTVATCAPARSCSGPRSCLADESCAPQRNAAGTGLELVCTPGLGKGGGEACRFGSDCQSGVCLHPGLCAGGCSVDADCPRGPEGQVELCRPLDLTLGGASGSLRLCQVRPPACQRDADCTRPGEICRPFRSLDDPARLSPGCGPAPNPGKAPPGAACMSAADCSGAFCMSTTQPPVCYGLCQTDADCAAGRRCYADYVHFLTGGMSGEPAATYDATSACAPDIGSRRSCLGSGAIGDCPAGEVCVALPNAQQTGWLRRCQRPAGTGGGGAACTAGADCQSGRCLLIGGARRCLGLCSVGGPAVCAAGTTCRAGTLDVRPGHPGALTYCQ